MKQTAVEFAIEAYEKFINSENGNGEAYFHKQLVKDIEQAKAMEKEQMIGFAEFVAGYPDKNRNHLGQMLHAKSKYDGAERTVDLLEEYYNETYAK